MKSCKSILLASAALVASVPFAYGSVVLSDTFAYTNGALVGQGSWAQTGSSATNPIQVSSGSAILGTAGGQDAYKALSAPQALATVGTLYFAMDLKISAVNATGDYFFHVTPTVGDSSLFFSRLFAKSAGAGYVLGLVDTSGTGSTFTFGSSVLSFASDYQVVIAWNSVTGATNDTFKVYVNPVSGTESSNTAYLSHTWTSVSAEPVNVAAVNFRQGANLNSPAVTVYDITVATTFAEAAGIAAVPEPSTYAAVAGGIALAGVVAARRRRAPVVA